MIKNVYRVPLPSLLFSCSRRVVDIVNRLMNTLVPFQALAEHWLLVC